MTLDDQDRCPQDRGDEVAGFLLRALDDQASAGFADHLTGCQPCQAYAERLRVAVDVLPLTAAQYAAPPAIKKRLMEAIRAEAKQSPEGVRAGRPPLRRLRARWPRLRSPAPTLAPAVALTVAVAGGVWIGGGFGAGHTPPRARVIDAQVLGMPSAAARLRQLGDRAELDVTGMKPPPPGRVYQVWLRRPDQVPQPTNALFSVTRAGSAAVVVPDPPPGVQRILVTAEPTGGSSTPTRSPVIIAPLT